MSIQAILLPLFVQVALTFVVFTRMAVLRGVALRGGEVQPQDIALREPKWPVRATQAAHAFSNQLELPMLFYVLTILALHTRHADLLFVVLAWIFVISRIIHAFVHVTFNRVPVRGAVYGVGALVLMAMWIIFAVDVVFAL